MIPRMTVETPKFRLVMRGYSRPQVHEVVVYVRMVLASPDAAQHARLREQLSDASFDIALRGYDRDEVDAYLDRVARQLAEGLS
jgi:DivIVA domain-containing protein